MHPPAAAPLSQPPPQPPAFVRHSHSHPQAHLHALHALPPHPLSHSVPLPTTTLLPPHMHSHSHHRPVRALRVDTARAAGPASPAALAAAAMSPSATAFSSAMHALVSNLLAKTDTDDANANSNANTNASADAAAADARHSPTRKQPPRSPTPPRLPTTPATLNQLASPTPSTPVPPASLHPDTQQLHQHQELQHQRQHEQQQHQRERQQQHHELLSPPAPAPEHFASPPNIMPPRLIAKRSRSGRAQPSLPQLITSASPSANFWPQYPSFDASTDPCAFESTAKAARIETSQSVASNTSNRVMQPEFSQPSPLSTIRNSIISSMHQNQIASFSDPYTPLTRVFNELASIPLTNYTPEIDHSTHPVDPVIQYLVGNFAETMKEFRNAPVNSMDPNVFAYQPLPEARMLFDRELSLAFSTASGDSMMMDSSCKLGSSFIPAGMPQHQQHFAQMHSSLQSLPQFNIPMERQSARPLQSLQPLMRAQFAFHQPQRQLLPDSVEHQPIALEAVRTDSAASVSDSIGSNSNNISMSPFQIKKQLMRADAPHPPPLQPQQLQLLPPGLRGTPPTRTSVQHGDGLFQQLLFNTRPAVPSPLAAEQGKPRSSNFLGPGGAMAGPAEAKFKCAECRKAFKLQDSLTSHMLVAHAAPASTSAGTGPPPAAADDTPSSGAVKLALACEFCEQTFSRSHDLKRHLFSHKGERPFSCGRCGKGFSRRDILRKHQEAFALGKKINCFPAVAAAASAATAAAESAEDGGDDATPPVAAAAASSSDCGVESR
ncbi:hypothetical protein HDU84_009818 [Entophlyctis sp. JEL0112]|nr:hypothetical protein HDU84_009818 [Entophlyctis sp. JEL0112]